MLSHIGFFPPYIFHFFYHCLIKFFGAQLLYNANSLLYSKMNSAIINKDIPSLSDFPTRHPRALTSGVPCATVVPFNYLSVHSINIQRY